MMIKIGAIQVSKNLTIKFIINLFFRRYRLNMYSLFVRKRLASVLFFKIFLMLRNHNAFSVPGEGFSGKQQPFQPAHNGLLYNQGWSAVDASSACVDDKPEPAVLFCDVTDSL